MIAGPDKDLTLAFAGMIQSATLVCQLAKQDRYDREALWQSAQSLIRLDTDRTEEVYGSVYGVELGLRKIILLFGSRSEVEDRDIFNYTIFVHQISTRLLKLEKTSRIIHAELEEIRYELHRRDGPGPEPERLFELLAGLYSRTISYLTPRIIVRGEPDRLQDPATVNRVRTALFSGIRAAYLWNQLGGRRWKIVFQRKAYVKKARQLLAYEP
ncbi:MAG: DUF489 family protein [Gammaproteobacteria bacterium]|nr:DUF489 family protein [Gammaproteobacteria bacterium]